MYNRYKADKINPIKSNIDWYDLSFSRWNFLVMGLYQTAKVTRFN